MGIVLGVPAERKVAFCHRSSTLAPPGSARAAHRYGAVVLHLLVDTSVWLDLAKKRDGQKLIHAVGQMMLEGSVEILVPQIVRDEFERNRERIEASMTTSVADRFRNLQKEVEGLSAEWHRPAFEATAGLAHEMPLIGTMATRNFTDILRLFENGRLLEPSVGDRDRVLERGLAKKAPFLRGKNSTADAMLIEMYATFSRSPSDPDDVCGFVTSNSKDFSQEKGDVRLPHPDIADLFDGESSRYLFGVVGLQDSLDDHLGEELEEILIMSDFQEDREHCRRSNSLSRSFSTVSDTNGRFATGMTGKLDVTGLVRPKRAFGYRWTLRNAPERDDRTFVRQRITSNEVCGTASCRRSVGCLAASGTS
jgi:hypothetical protein